MKLSSVLSCTLGFALPNFFVRGGGNEGCIDSIAELEYYESRVSSFATVRQYILCEDTYFDAGALHPFYGTKLSNSTMLHLRPNLHIQCGATGRRENNCHVRYGDIHIDGTSFYGVPSEPLENVVIEGVTFIDSRKHVAFIDKPGDVEFRDCVFRVSLPRFANAINLANVGLCTLKNNTKSLLPVKLDYFDPSAANDELFVKFRGCTFVHNRYSGTPANPALVVGTSSQNSISIIDCDFAHNDMTDAGGVSCPRLAFSI